MGRLKQLIVILQRRGFGYLLYLVTGVALPRLEYALLYRVPHSRLRRLVIVLFAASTILLGILLVWWMGWGKGSIALMGVGLVSLVGYWSFRTVQLNRKRDFARQAQLNWGQRFIRLADYPLEADTRKAIESAKLENPGIELVIGQIDNDGRVYGQFGCLPFVTNVPREEFVPRYRFPLDIVILDDLVLVRKDFSGNRERFIAEWHNLARLDGVANVPAVCRADEEKFILYKSLVCGRTVRDLLVEAGADILTVNVQKDASLKDLSEDERIHAVWERGQALLAAVFPGSFFEQMEDQLDRIHARGLARLSLTFGNVMVDAGDGSPWLIDMEGAKDFGHPAGLIFNFERDCDREKYNRIYGRSIITERSARRILSEYFSNNYAPIDFGGGLTTHGFWTTESGTGRWEYLNGRVVLPLVEGRRVLDLGANNGLMDLMMLKGGAREVTGLEVSPEYGELAGWVHQLFEWRDMKKYAFTLQACDMREILNNSDGEFDVVTAFCSLYYLDEEDMAAVVRKASSIAPVMILQGKTNARLEVEEKGRKSNPEYLAGLLKNNGFPYVEGYSPNGFSRPIVVGRVHQ